MYYQLSKSEKKIAKAIIDKGIDIEFRNALAQIATIIAEWQNATLDNRTAYHQVYKKLDEGDSRISRRYDNLGGSRWLETVGQIFADGQITEEEIKGFSEETRDTLKHWVTLINGE